MSTLIVPHTVPPVSDDCEQLRKAFSGFSILFLYYLLVSIVPCFCGSVFVVKKSSLFTDLTFVLVFRSLRSDDDRLFESC